MSLNLKDLQISYSKRSQHSNCSKVMTLHSKQSRSL